MLSDNLVLLLHRLVEQVFDKAFPKYPRELMFPDVVCLASQGPLRQRERKS